MRSTLLLALLFVCLSALSQKKVSPVGTWKLVSMNWSKGDSTGKWDETMVNHIKIITPTHYATLTQNMDGTFRRAMGGKVRFDGASYTEIATHGSSESTIGGTSTFKYEIKGNKMHLAGNSGSYYFDEIWQRVQ